MHWLISKTYHNFYLNSFSIKLSDSEIYQINSASARSIFEFVNEITVCYIEENPGSMIDCNSTNAFNFYPQKLSLKSSLEDESILGVTAEYLKDLNQELRDPDGGMVLRNRTILNIVFASTFKGLELIEWLQSKKKINQGQALKIAQKLLDAHYISHSSTDLLPFTRVCWYTFVKR